ncbi:MAG TPA: twin-arginine translocase subunit TatC [Proteiniclasticum sp.]|nr:twin-arginine translocase subunit TatC [Proteiniclasticum sp.]
MKKKKTKRNKEDKLTLVEHLTELRNRIVYMAVALVAAILVSYNFAEILVKDMIGIVPDINFVFIAPAELLLSYIKIAVIIGLVVSAPFLITQIWLFVSPGLEKKERRTIVFSLMFGGVFFIIGAVFAYIIVLPLMIQFFMSFQMEGIDEMISFASYLSLVMNTVLSFGLIFEMPSIMVILTRLGVVRSKFLRQNRKYIILIIFVLAAVLTPPDVISQTLLALPMILLFELGIFLSRIVERKRDAAE